MENEAVLPLSHRLSLVMVKTFPRRGNTFRAWDKLQDVRPFRLQTSTRWGRHLIFEQTSKGLTKTEEGSRK